MRCFPSLLGLLATGCPGKQDTGDSFTCAQSDHLAVISEVHLTADEANNRWIYEVLMEGVAVSVWMDIHQSTAGDWREFFSLRRTGYDPSCTWDTWGRTLTDSDSLADYVADGDVTINDPTLSQWAHMTWMFQSYGTWGNDPDCVIGGAEPEVFARQECRLIDLSPPDPE